MVHTERPELILLDVVMPGKSGYDLCRELKEDPFTRLIPVVMITGLSDRDDRVRGIEAGADDFLSKPLYPEELFARVKSLLKLKEFTDELENAEAVLVALALGIESRDPYTGNHCETAGPLRCRPGTPHRTGRRQHHRAEARRLSARPGQGFHSGRHPQERHAPDRRRMGHHEAAPGDRRIDLPPAEVIPQCVCRSSAIITSIGTAAAIRTGLRDTIFHCWREFFRWWTCTTHCAPPARINRR